MIETVVAYVIIIAPSLISALGTIVSFITAIRKLNKSGDEVTIIKNQAVEAFNDIKNSNEFKELRSLCKKVISENALLKEKLIENTEALTRIRNNHPELFAKED